MRPVSGCTHQANVWTFENRISSDSETKVICLPELPEEAKELIGKLVKVDGKTKLNGIFKYDPFQPDSKVTTDGFDQSLLYHNLHSVPAYLMEFGFKIPEIIRKRRGEVFKITGHANGTDALNAWYSPQNGEMTFGTNDGKWHLASDSDISTHEEGHLILDHYHPSLTGWYSKEGGAIHEGFADALAAGYFDDAEMSEDFAPFKGKPESKDDGLRTVNNDLTLDDVSNEVHDRGQVYGGFFWSVKKAMADPSGSFKLSSRGAADCMLKLLVNHGANYKTSRPSSKDFVDAVLAGMNGLAREGKLGVDAKKLEAIIISEAIRRKLVEPDYRFHASRTSFESVRAVEQYLAKIGVSVKFDKSHEASFIGGTFEIYGQQIASKKFGTINMLGRGIMVQKDSRGNIISLSAKDILPIKVDQIDDSGDITLDEAIQLALTHSRVEHQEGNSRIRDFYKQAGGQPISKLAELKMEQEIAKTDLENLSKMHALVQEGKEIKHRMVLIDGSLVPHYEFKVGLSIYYVNSKTGDVTRHKDVIVN